MDFLLRDECAERAEEKIRQRRFRAERSSFSFVGIKAGNGCPIAMRPNGDARSQSRRNGNAKQNTAALIEDPPSMF